MKKFTVHVIGSMSEELSTQLQSKLSPELIKLGFKPEIIQLDEKKHIAAAYHETFNGDMLIIYRVPYQIPHFGSLSQDLFGLVENKQTKVREYPKKIYIYTTVELEQKAWRCYLNYLIDQFTWSGTQVTLPEPNEILKNTSIISSFDELIIPTDDEIQKLNSRRPVENIVYELNPDLQQRFAKKYSELKQTRLIYLNEYDEKTRDLINPERDKVIATVISCASPLQPHNEEHNAFMKRIGKVLAEQNVLHLYGGATVGIMGLVAFASRDGDGEVSAVIGAPQCDTYVHHNPPSPELGFLKKFIFAASLQTRIKILMNLGDMTIMFPAGTGTFEELTTQLVDCKGKPVVIVKVGKHLDHVEKHIRELQDLGFLHQSIYFVANEHDITKILVPLLKTTLGSLKQREKICPESTVVEVSVVSKKPPVHSTSAGKLMISSGMKWMVGGSLLLGAGMFALRYLAKKNQASVASTITPGMG